MSKDIIQEFLIFQLEYKATNERKIKLFGKYFVKENKDKCKIIYNKKENKLTEYLDIVNNDNNKIKIQLIINNNITIISYMFQNCQELLSFRYISNLNDCSNVNKSFNESDSDNYIDELIDLKEDEENENIYNDNLTISSISINTYISEFTGINELINKLNTQSKKVFSNVTDMNFMFYGCSSLKSLPDLSKWDIKNVTNMYFMFDGCSSLKSIPDISKWNTKNVTDMESMFRGCSSLISLPDISKWNTKNVTDISSMFDRCSSLISLTDISKWNTNNITNMNNMFKGCSSLIVLPDISKWDIKNIIYMNNIFNGCSSLISIPDISKWKTKNVIDMYSMFNGCSSLNSFPDISKLCTMNVTDMESMFEDVLH